jgi:trans-aconitate methyltransferase
VLEPDERETAVPDFDTGVPHIARIYDYWLGGKDNFAADREAAELAMAATPTIVPGVRANRRFLGRAVRYLTGAGIRQFLDVGTGIPTAGNTHEVAQSAAPQARVVYVDNDPIVLSHARALLTSTTGPIDYIEADARDTAAILAGAARTLDFSQPVGIMLIAVLHCIPDSENPRGIITALLDAFPSGSFLALSHPARDQVAVAVRAETSLTKSTGQKVTFRTRDQVLELAAGLDLVEPGVVPVQEWRPDSILDFNSPPTAMWGCVAGQP